MTDSERCSAYVLNGYVVNYFDGGKRPTLNEMRSHWSAKSWENLSDELVEDIIERVSKYYK